MQESALLDLRFGASASLEHCFLSDSWNGQAISAYESTLHMTSVAVSGGFVGGVQLTNSEVVITSSFFGHFYAREMPLHWVGAFDNNSTKFKVSAVRYVI